MGFERIVGLTLKDDKGYQSYREAMTPILIRYGGRFRFDFSVAKTLITEGDGEINRVFVMTFPDQSTHDRFFSDPEYKAIRAKHYDPSVKTSTVISQYTIPG